MTNAIFTVGHSTLEVDAFIGLLRQAGADFVVDVRRFPRSRRHPQFNDDALAARLAEDGIGYEHIAALGGRRAGTGAGSINAYWREAGFRNYAGYALTADFRHGLERLLDIADTRRPAIMCAEAVWWRCHRRIITDYLLAAGVTVLHIMQPFRLEPAELTAAAVRVPEGLVYPPADPELGL
ncbi:MAG: DUF488 family protein [Bauldia sp.]